MVEGRLEPGTGLELSGNNDELRSLSKSTLFIYMMYSWFKTREDICLSKFAHFKHLVLPRSLGRDPYIGG